jgi:AraC-like DNA-binding protein
MEKSMAELRRIVMRAQDKWTQTVMPRVAMVRAQACADQVYQPMLHLVLQGTKTLSIGEDVTRYVAGSYFLVPVDVPATGQVHAGAADQPYLAVSLTLDPDVIATLLMDEGKAPRAPQNSCFQGVPAPDEMIDAWVRMMRLVDRPHEAAVLAPMIEREILYRALQGPLGGILRDVARPDGRMTQIRRVTQWIREHYTEPFRVEPLALMSEMSVAAFYRHFKSVTAMTPIQYQKRLRLLRARWLLLFDTLDATSVAYRVGYESASQFNREYARLFGLPPVRDAARFRSPTDAGGAVGQLPAAP